jgi:endonuclease/exonuclease/phosphatase family metal-dependent hydrolase
MHVEKSKLENLILVGDFNAKSYEWNNRTENKHEEYLEHWSLISKLTISVALIS